MSNTQRPSNIPPSHPVVPTEITDLLRAVGLPVPSHRAWRRKANTIAAAQPGCTPIEAAYEAYQAIATAAFITEWRSIVRGWDEFHQHADPADNEALIDDSLLFVFNGVSRDIFGLGKGRKLGRRFAAPTNPGGFMRTAIRNARTDVLRRLRADAGRMSREDWLFRSDERVALFSDDPTLALVADLLTRWLWWPETLGDTLRNDVMPVDSWIVALGLDASDPERRTAARQQVVGLATEVVRRINEHYVDTGDSLGTVADRNVNVPLAQRAMRRGHDGDFGF